MRGLPALAAILCTVLVMAPAQAGGSSGSDTDCSDEGLDAVCAAAAVTLDVACALDGDLATCTWTAEWEASFSSALGLPGEGAAPAWLSATVCGAVFCMNTGVDFFSSCTWTSEGGCTFAFPYNDSSGALLDAGECLEASVEFGVPAFAAAPRLALPAFEAEAFALAFDEAAVCA